MGNSPIKQWTIRYANNVTKTIEDDDLVKVRLDLHGSLKDTMLYINNPNIIVGFMSSPQCKINTPNTNNFKFDDIVPYSTHSQGYFIPNVYMATKDMFTDIISITHGNKKDTENVLNEYRILDREKKDLFNLILIVNKKYPGKTIYFKIVTCMAINYPISLLTSCFNRTSFVPSIMNFTKTIPFKTNNKSDGTNIGNLQWIVTEGDTFGYVGEKKFHNDIKFNNFSIDGITHFSVDDREVVFNPVDGYIGGRQAYSEPECGNVTMKDDSVTECKETVPVVFISKEDHEKVPMVGVRALTNIRYSRDFSKDTKNKIENNRNKIVDVSNIHIPDNKLLKTIIDKEIASAHNNRYNIMYKKTTMTNLDKLPVLLLYTDNAFQAYVESKTIPEKDRDICEKAWSKFVESNKFGARLRKSHRRRTRKSRRRTRKSHRP